MRAILVGVRNSVNATSRSEEHTSELQSQSNLVCRLLLEKKKNALRSEEHTSELQSQSNLVCRLLLEKKNNTTSTYNRQTRTSKYSTSLSSYIETCNTRCDS